MEYGGYLEFENLINNEYYSNLIRLNTARNALIYILKARNIKKIYIPFFLCDSVLNILKKNNYDYDFYHINEKFLPIFNKKLNDNEYLYIVNYYGQLDNKKIILLKEKYHNIIVDNVQSFFQKPVKNVDTIYSCRKYFGVPDGAYLSTNCFLDEKLDYDKSGDRFKYLLGRYEENAQKFYNDYKEHEESFSNFELRYMSKITNNILGAINYKNVIKQRNKNYAYLEKKLKSINEKNFIWNNGPFCYPLYISNGVSVRKKLIEKNIYIPVLWSNVLEIGNDLEKELVNNILCLPIDQRYREEDMENIIKIIKETI